MKLSSFRFDVVKWLELNGPQGTTTLAASEDDPNGLGPAIKINLAGEDDEAREKEKRERDAEAKRQQNQLPDWIARSTITGESANAATSGRKADEGRRSADSKPSLADSRAVDEDGSPHKNTEDDLDAYYASLAAEAPPAQPALDPASVALPISTAPSPAMSTGTPRSVSMAPRNSGSGDDSIATPAADEIEATMRSNGDSAANGAGKRSRDELEASSNVVTPSGEGETKKARLGSVDSGVAAVPAEDDDDEDDEDFEEIEEGDGDPNPMIAIGDKLVPFLEVGEELQAAMVSIGDPCTLFRALIQCRTDTRGIYGPSNCAAVLVHGADLSSRQAYWDVFQRLG